MKVSEAGEKWGLTPRSIQIHCEKGNIPGVIMVEKVTDLTNWAD